MGDIGYSVICFWLRVGILGGLILKMGSGCGIWGEGFCVNALG